MQDPHYLKFFENNQDWVKRQIESGIDLNSELAPVNQPELLFIGCSDNRIPASQLMGIDPGKVIVHRNIANLVNPIDSNVLSVIHYAVEHLKVKRVVVCGHYNCSCIHTAMKPKDYGTLNAWLRNVRDVYKENKAELLTLANDQQRLDRLAELNVLAQCTNITKMAVLQNNYHENGYPTVHGWIFDTHTGYIKDLGFKFDETIQNIEQIYSLTDETFFDADK